MGVYWKTREAWFNSQEGARDFFFSKASSGLWAAHSILLSTTDSFPGVSRAGNDVDHSSIWCQG